MLTQAILDRQIFSIFSNLNGRHTKIYTNNQFPKGKPLKYTCIVEKTFLGKIMSKNDSFKSICHKFYF